MSLRVRHVYKRFGERPVVQDVSFDVANGKLVALLGPSGSGKSTILRIVAGLTPCDSGLVQVDGEDVTEQPPQQRDLGFVFQNYALFEHMTVADNIEFALRVRGVERTARACRRDELLEQVGLGGSARKYAFSAAFAVASLLATLGLLTLLAKVVVERRLKECRL